MDTNDIVTNREDISLTTTADSVNDFCKVWPGLEKGLELLESIVKDPVAKGAISLVIATGDAVSKKICVI